jgi:hypothetical protein
LKPSAMNSKMPPTCMSGGSGSGNSLSSRSPGRPQGVAAAGAARHGRCFQDRRQAGVHPYSRCTHSRC